MKKILLVVIMLVGVNIGSAEDKKVQTDLDAAISLAREQKKLLFVKYGREACGNCRHLAKLITEKKVELSESEFVVVDLDCDAEDDRQAFWGKYRAAFENAKTLPFVVIADSDGTLATSRASYASADDYNRLVGEGKQKIKK